MFDPVSLTHDEIVERLIAVRAKVTVKSVSDAFLASLSSRRLDLRSALGSFAFSSSFPNHNQASSPMCTVPSGAEHCLICGIYCFPEPDSKALDRFGLEREKWGGLRHLNPIYAWYDLSQFLLSEKCVPTEVDRQILRTILQIAAQMPQDARPSALSKLLGSVLKSNESERRALVQILSLCGILQPRNEGGFFEQFTPDFQRRGPDEHTNDWPYPAIFWRGSDGVNAAAIAAYFPDL